MELDPKGSAGGDLVGFKATETGNNTTKLHIYKNITLIYAKCYFYHKKINRLVFELLQCLI